jgi:3-hydroxybutyryl-CoA dehydrogenase
MVDVSEHAVRKGIAMVEDSLARLVKKDRMALAEKEVVLARIEGSTDYGKLAEVDFASRLLRRTRRSSCRS